MDPVTRFLTAARGQTVDRPPVWLMRQAGRYLPEYQALRKRHDFLTCCRTPELATEITLQPWRRFGMDGVVVFCDILIPIAAMGMPLTVEDAGPRLDPPIVTLADVERLSVPDPEQQVPFLLSTLASVREAVNGKAAVIGFAGGPWTLATYMVTGGGMTSRERCTALLLDDARFRAALFAKLRAMLVPYLTAQAKAGAHVLQIFETWAGLLSPIEFDNVVLPVLSEVIADVRKAVGTKVPIVIYCGECRHLVEQLGSSGADVVSVDWRLTLTEARLRLPAGVSLQGNLPPELLLKSEPEVRKATQVMCVEGGDTGYIANLGHGVLKQTPVANVAAFVETVQKWNAASTTSA
ncbi:MAG: uroporphyrinogen decarboxylase [Deltaproteobacteria bacterium]|nr:uroporphyrinogen decarboxylase [Deltaproteobacteria bacterium]